MNSKNKIKGQCLRTTKQVSQGGSEILRPRLTQNPNCLGVVV